MRRTGNRGQVLLVFLGALLALLGIAALGIDVGYLYTVRHELQRCTDAGALAGASAFLSGNWSDGATRAVADGRARAFAAKDKVAAAMLSPGRRDRRRLPLPGPGPRRRHPQRQPLLRPPLPRADENRDRLLDRRGVGGRHQREGAEAVGDPLPVGGHQRERPVRPRGDGPQGLPGRGPDPSRYFCPGTRVILKIGTPKNSPKNPNGLPSLQQEPGHFFALDLRRLRRLRLPGRGSRERAPSRSAWGIPSPGNRKHGGSHGPGDKNAPGRGPELPVERGGGPPRERPVPCRRRLLDELPPGHPDPRLRPRGSPSSTGRRAWSSPGSRGSGSRASSTTRGPSSDAISRIGRSGRPAPRRVRRPVPSSRRCGWWSRPWRRRSVPSSSRRIPKRSA